MISGGLRGVKECPNAEEAYLRALAIREKKLGPDHPDVDWSLKNPGYLYYYDMRDYARAALLYERALAIREKALGPDHSQIDDCRLLLLAQYSTQRARSDQSRRRRLNYHGHQKQFGEQLRTPRRTATQRCHPFLSAIVRLNSRSHNNRDDCPGLWYFLGRQHWIALRALWALPLAHGGEKRS